MTKIMLSWRTLDGEARILWGSTSYRRRNLYKIYSPSILGVKSRAFKQSIISKHKRKLFVEGSDICFTEYQFRLYSDRTMNYILFSFYGHTQRSRKKNHGFTSFAPHSSFRTDPTNLFHCFPLDSSGRSVHTNVGCDNHVTVVTLASLTRLPGQQQ